MFSSDMSFLMVFSDWSYHLRVDFCFLVGGPLIRNLTVCLVSSRIRLEKSNVMELISGSSFWRQAVRIWILSLNWGDENLVWRRCMASGDQSNFRRGELVACGCLS